MEAGESSCTLDSTLDYFSSLCNCQGIFVLVIASRLIDDITLDAIVEGGRFSDYYLVFYNCFCILRHAFSYWF